VVEETLDDPDPWVVQKAAYAVRDLARNLKVPANSDQLKRLLAKISEVLMKREASSDRTDRQIVIPTLRAVSSTLENLLRR
jgi:RNA polymerase-interacting CarD/CdnL/TRCF family regulator